MGKLKHGHHYYWH